MTFMTQKSNRCILSWILLGWIIVSTPLHAIPALTLPSLFKPMSRLGSSTASYTFHSNGATDTINYVQLSSCTDTTCNTCNVPYQIITAASQTSPLTITSGGSTYGINLAALTSYLNTYAGFTSSATHHIGLYVQSASQNCSSSYCSQNRDSVSQNLCIDATYSGSAVTNISQVDNGVVTLDAATAQIVYIVDSGNQAVYYCSIDGTNPSTGALSCTETSSTGLTSPWSIAIGTVSGVQYAYVMQTGVDPSDNIVRCSINNNGSVGDLSGCLSVGTNLFGGAGGSPFQIAFATVSQTQYAYVANGSTIFKCGLNTDGTFSSCTEMTTLDFADIEGIAFSTLPTGLQSAYLADQNSGVWQCSLDASGDFAGCSPTTDSPASTDHTMQTITFAKVNGVQYAYMGAGSRGTTYKCNLNATTGALAGCSLQPTTQPSGPSWGPYGITSVIVNGGGQFVYVMSQGFISDIYSVPIQSNGTLGVFSQLSAGITWSSPNAVTSAYIQIP